MNQALADLFLSLPQWMTAPHVFGSFCLALCWAYYWADIRGPITRAVHAACDRGFWAKYLPRARHRLFYTAARQKAKLDEGGMYLTNLAAFWLLCVATAIHIPMAILGTHGMALAVTVDLILLTVTAVPISVLALLTQPATTLERRARWGFHRPGNIVRAVLREGLILALLFAWLYVAWFLPALL